MSRLLTPLVLAAGLAVAAPAALAAPPTHRLVHVVQSGDTLSGIAHRYGCPLDELIRRNNLRSDHIVVGSKLSVPWPDPRLRVATEIHISVHRVLPGETLLSIADRYDADARSIRLYNAVSGDRIRVGQRLEIPTAGPALTRHTFGYEVQPGDTVGEVAQRLDVPVRHIRYLNPGADLRNLEVGQILTVYRYEPLSDEAAAVRAQPTGVLGGDAPAAASGGAEAAALEGPVDIDIDDFDDAEEPPATPTEQAEGALKAAGEVVARATGSPAPARKAAPQRQAKAPAKAQAAPKRTPRPAPSPKANACHCTCPPPASESKGDADDDFAYERGE